MIVHRIEQRTPAWDALRLGRPTSSAADLILTPAKLEPSKSAAKYLNKLLAEWLLGYSLDGDATQYMERGTALEPDAREWYALVHGREVEPVGFITTDDGVFGGSPDALVGDLGMLEIKCPGIVGHIGYMRSPASLVAEYRGQVQTQLWVSEREWVDLLSFHPELPPVVQRVERDDRYIHAFAGAVYPFADALAEAKRELAPFRRADPTIAAVEAAEVGA
jgi:hypothetical protein